VDELKSNSSLTFQEYSPPVLNFRLV